MKKIWGFCGKKKLGFWKKFEFWKKKMVLEKKTGTKKIIENNKYNSK